MPQQFCGIIEASPTHRSNNMITINGYTFWMEDGELMVKALAGQTHAATILTSGNGRAEAHQAWEQFTAEAA
jgi:hypothetical protein